MLSGIENEEQRLGALILKRCCEQPMKKIYDNLNQRDGLFENGGGLIEALKDLQNPSSGFDACNKVISLDIMKEAGVVDPVKVVKSALRYGAGLASILLTAECAIVEEKYNFVARFHEQIRL